jgi:hypothetical protein
MDNGNIAKNNDEMTVVSDTEVKDNLARKKDDIKRAILHFYSEIVRLNKGEDRKYEFPITFDTCMETIGQCYELNSIFDELRLIDPEKADEYEVELQNINLSLTAIEEYSHSFKESVAAPNDPVEILSKRNAVSVSSPSVSQTKGRERKNRISRNIKLPDEIGKEEKVGNITSVVSGSDVDKNELYNVDNIQSEPEIDEIPIDAEVIIKKHDDNIPQDKKVEDTLVLEKKEDDSTDLLIVQKPKDDEINLQIVVNNNDKDSPPEENEPLSDNIPLLTEDDVIADGKQEDLDDIDLIIGENKQIDDDSIEELPEEFSEHSVKDISRSKTYSFKARLQKKNIDEKTVSEINLFQYNENDENLRKEYLETHNNMLSAPHVSRVNLLMSGYFVEISSYGNWDTLSLERIMRDKSIDFVDKEIAILNSIYSHIEYFSYTSTKPEFNEWLDTVKYPDYDILFYGLFDANYDGINYFRIRCPYCGNNDIIVGKENKDLIVAIDKNYTNQLLVEQITTKEMNKLDTSSTLPKWANSSRVRVMANNTKILFEYKVPTLLDYLTMLSTARRIANRDSRPLDLVKILDPESDEYSRLLLYLYIKTIGLPSPVYNNPDKPKEATSYKYIGLNNKADVIETVNAIDIEDYSMLISSDAVRDLLTKKSVYYFVKDSKCTNEKCGKIIKYVNLDPRSIFFSRIYEATRNLIL